ncbi:NRDE family protein [Flavobacterium soli]|uniref:NRDE family protein n=1 Tax=Flavobacterium soli TaxID=344881 RepID=UPI0004273BB5|nr:NRDE family protein [Flavobacterium soli]
MCTVSFVPSKDKIIITSNRDEAVLRTALPPETYLINQKKITFPKDPKAGGTWYAVAENGTVLVLLNGADEKHKHQPPYSRSRGLIVLELISNDSPINHWNAIDLENVEPFTLVLYQDSKLYQLRWNGSIKSRVDLDTSKNHIWSSSTLYPKEIREQRSEWFYRFMQNKEDASEDEMFGFHRYTENSNAENGLIINRNDALKTLTITQTVLQNDKIIMNHYDLIDGENYNVLVNSNTKFS